MTMDCRGSSSSSSSSLRFSPAVRADSDHVDEAFGSAAAITFSNREIYSFLALSTFSHKNEGRGVTMKHMVMGATTIFTNQAGARERGGAFPFHFCATLPHNDIGEEEGDVIPVTLGL